MDFKLVSNYSPTGDQPNAIAQLVEGANAGERYQTLMGVTGSGKTFTMANVIKELNRPALILSHNKTLAAQLYSEFKEFFPENLVEYFVSYYDYYQPEAFLPTTNTFIEKDLSINEEIEKLRLSTTSALLSGRRDIIVVASVSCIYGIGNPEEFYKNVIDLKRGQLIARNSLLNMLVGSLYSRNDQAPERGNFRVKGDVVDIFLAYADHGIRVLYWDDEIEGIEAFSIETGQKLYDVDEVKVYPANIFVTTRETQNDAIWAIQQDMVKQVDFFRDIGKPLEAKRLQERTEYDLEMMRELGYCSGIENYSRYFDKREAGQRPFCIIDYFPKDFLFFMDESHVTNSQIKAMYGGDRSRKVNLVEHGFRLPAAMDNRPLKYDEFESMIPQWMFISATPGDYELEKSEGVVVEQIIRPTGLLDPRIEVRPSENQVDDLMEEIQLRVDKDERVLCTTLTKRMAEELTKFLDRHGVRCRYIHSDVDTIERIEILRELRLGSYDVLVGVNLLREGLDLPEVSLVAILDADKEGFLRSERALVQTTGRAARNVNGMVIMYADRITESMRKTIEQTERRRTIQLQYNEEHGITPTQIFSSREDIIKKTSVANNKKSSSYYSQDEEVSRAAEPDVVYSTPEDLKKAISEKQKQMQRAAKDLDFIEAARLRDEMKALKSRVRS